MVTTSDANEATPGWVLAEEQEAEEHWRRESEGEAEPLGVAEPRSSLFGARSLSEDLPASDDEDL